MSTLYSFFTNGAGPGEIVLWATPTAVNQLAPLASLRLSDHVLATINIPGRKAVDSAIKALNCGDVCCSSKWLSGIVTLSNTAKTADQMNVWCGVTPTPATDLRTKLGALQEALRVVDPRCSDDAAEVIAAKWELTLANMATSWPPKEMQGASKLQGSPGLTASGPFPVAIVGAPSTPDAGFLGGGYLHSWCTSTLAEKLGRSVGSRRPTG